MKRHSEDAFSREPEVAVVTAKTTTYHTNSTQVPLQKVQKKALTVICTIVHNLFKFHTNYKIFQQSVYTVGPPHNSQKRKHNFGFHSVSFNNSERITQIASNLKYLKRFLKASRASEDQTSTVKRWLHLKLSL